AQKRLYFLQQMDLESTAYNMTAVLPVGKDIQKEKLESVLIELTDRHESLRTSFGTVNENPVQRVHDHVEFEIVRGMPLQPLEDFVRPFDLGQAPLIRSLLIRHGDGNHTWLVDMHHIISDGTSTAVLLEDFQILYSGGTLPGIDIRYKDFSGWQNRLIESGRIKAQEDYWLDLYSDSGDIPRLDLAVDRKRPKVFTYEGNQYNTGLTSAETTRFKSLASRYNGTLYMNMLAVLNTLFFKYTGQTDIIIGAAVAGRPHADLQRIIGMFVNSLPMRNYPRGQVTYETFLKKVIANSLNAFENQDVPFEKLVDRLDIKRDLSRNPLFDISMALENFNRPAGEDILPIAGSILPPVEYEAQTAKFDMTFFISEREDSVSVTIEYYTGIFHKETIQRLATHLKTLITTVNQNPFQYLKDIEIISGAEKRELLHEFNDTLEAFPSDKTIPQLVQEQVERTPENVALIMGNASITYMELNRQANRLAGEFIKKGVQTGSIVGIMLERSIELMIGILGILKAGGAYLPIDPDYPKERIDFMLRDSGAGILLLDPAEIIERDYTALGTGNNLNAAGYSDLAYIIYTSGSTGKPKGVMIEHVSVVNLVFTQRRRFGIDERDRVLQFSAIGFDASVEQIFIALSSGAGLVLVDKETLLDPLQFEAFVSMRSITHIHAVPSFLDTINIRYSSSLKRIISGGDICPVSLAKRLSRFPGCDFYNEYGPTETTVTSVEMKIERVDEALQRLPIGRPVGNTQVYLLDKWDNPVPVGVAGEMVIGGAGVARGYLNRPELTKEKFEVRSSKFALSSPLYRTGDLARWLSDGNIEFLGRLDFQIKIRGFRIEPGEVESRLLEHGSIEQSVVIGGNNGNNETYLCAYLVPRQKNNRDKNNPQPDKLRDFLSRTLPDHMIPTYFIPVDAIPMTPAGKVDRPSLPAPGIRTPPDIETPQTAIEKKVVEIWAGILAIDQNVIGRDSNFFRLGGHSLKATLLTARIHQRLNVKVPLTEIFMSPSPRELAWYIRNASDEKFSTIQRAHEQDVYPLSSAQKRLYILQRIQPQSTVYNVWEALLIKGKVDIERFRETFGKLIRRHESLRTGFHMQGESAVQVIHQYEKVEFEIEYYDLAANRANQREAMAALMIDEFIRPFDLSTAPLLRAGLIHTGSAEPTSILIVDMHHIIADGISVNLFIKEFRALYKGEKLTRLGLRYRDYSEWRNRWMDSVAANEREAYWQGQFQGTIPVLNLPYDFPRPSPHSYDGDVVEDSIDAMETAALKEMASDRGMTLYMVLLAIYNIFLAKLSGQRDIVVGTPVAGRNHADLQDVIGMFVNTLPLRNFPGDHQTVEHFLTGLKERTLTAFENQDYPFETLVERLQVNRDLTRHPLFDVMFEMQNMEKQDIHIPGLTMTPYPSRNNTTQFDLMLSAMETGEQLNIAFRYCTKLFKRETLSRFPPYFKKVLRLAVSGPHREISSIEIIEEEERRRVLHHFNNTRTPYSKDKTIHRLFREQARRTPDRTAVIIRNTFVTYAKLNRQADLLANLLAEKGVQPGMIIAIMMERSIEMMIGLFGILRAGAAYLPIDSNYPGERVDFMLKDSGTGVILIHNDVLRFYTPPAAAGGVPLSGGELAEVRLIDLTGIIGINYPPFEKNHRNQLSTSPAYIIYTSGSTGKPKGVVIEHHSLVNRLQWMQNKYPLDEYDTILQKTTFTFDVSVWELFWWSVTGAKLSLTVPGGERDPGVMAATIERNRVTV
ncbi:MAG: amino acid adenylation domain-containing protein, partial [bacterium]|nr:amino acid adenylation domain-containing protein [bacterium]